MSSETNKQGLARSIPREVARQVRQRCGFGCVVCGNAFFQYDHFDPEFVDALEHNADGIALLCWEHHGKKKAGLLSEEDYTLARKSPAALQIGHATTQWTPITLTAPEILFGTFTFCGGTSIIKIANEVVLGFDPPENQGAPPKIRFHAFDRRGIESINIIDNEIRALNEAYDIEAVGPVWTIRSKMGDIDLVIRFDPPTRITIERLKLHYGHWSVNLSGPKFVLQFDGSDVTTIQGVAKVKGPCLFSLAADSAKIESKDMNITFGLGPSPIGTTPTDIGFSLNWPVYIRQNEDGNAIIIQRDDYTILPVYTRQSFAQSVADGNERIVECSPSKLQDVVSFLGNKGAVEMVGFNFGADSLPSARPWKEFAQAIAGFR